MISCWLLLNQIRESRSQAGEGTMARDRMVEETVVGEETIARKATSSSLADLRFLRPLRVLSLAIGP